LTICMNSTQVKEATLTLLSERGVKISDLADITYTMQKDYFPGLTMARCVDSVERVLAKREVQNAILTGIQLDLLAEQGKLLSPLQEMVESDEGLYGCDEILALSIVNVYGSIGLTTFGFLDKSKPGIIGRLNDKSGTWRHTFLDDIAGAIAAAASSRIAHRRQADLEAELEAAIHLE
jgi:phosphatidylglycerophosphatase A